MAIPNIKALKVVERIFKPEVDTKNVMKLGMLAFNDNEEAANKLLMAVVKAGSKPQVTKF